MGINKEKANLKQKAIKKEGKRYKSTASVYQDGAAIRASGRRFPGPARSKNEAPLS
jgi:hypothetical protein